MAAHLPTGKALLQEQAARYFSSTLLVYNKMQKDRLLSLCMYMLDVLNINELISHENFHVKFKIYLQTYPKSSHKFKKAFMKKLKIKPLQLFMDPKNLLPG